MLISKGIRRLQFAVIDIETTGGYAIDNGIIEIAVLITDGDIVSDSFYAMINPGITIPPFIEKLTGITNEVIQSQPSFESVAEQLFALIHDKVFVAHNVNFDYSFVKYHLGQQGYHLDSQKLCTIRLARKVVPGLRGYGLDKICNHLNIKIEGRHSAFGDAAATTKLLHQLIQKGGANHIDKMLATKNSEMSLPPNVDEEMVSGLPQKPGVYYFHEKGGKVIYVGKARNIKKRVKGHFSNNKTGKQKQEFLKKIYQISFQETATELMAFVLEGVEIKKRWPDQNRSQKHAERMFGLYSYIDSNGFKRLFIERKLRNINPYFTFTNLAEGYTVLRKLVKQFQLCPYLCFLSKKSMYCHLDQFECKGACQLEESTGDYNERVDECIKGFTEQLPSFVVMDKGIQPGEKSCILIEKGKFVGMGYVNTDDTIDLENLKSAITHYADNQYVRSLIIKYAERHPLHTFSF